MVRVHGVAGQADAVLGDLAYADVICQAALATGKLAVAGPLHMTTEAERDRLMDGHPDGEPILPEPQMEARGGNVNAGCSMAAIPRSLWDEVGGYDERFVGWGYEDVALLAACWALAGPHAFVPAAAYHLWHPFEQTLTRGNPEFAANETLGRRYLAARDDPDAMRALIDER